MVPNVTAHAVTFGGLREKQFPPLIIRRIHSDVQLGAEKVAKQIMNEVDFLASTSLSVPHPPHTTPVRAHTYLHIQAYTPAHIILGYQCHMFFLYPIL